LRDQLHLFSSASDIEALANSVPDSDGVIFVPAFAGLGAPYWDPHVKGAILGIHRGTQAAHIARAAIEAIAFQSAELLFAMQNDSQTTISELRVDGGAASNNTLLQFQADLLGIPVIRPNVLETTALGSAYLAGLQIGVYADLEECSVLWKQQQSFLPNVTRHAAHDLMQNWKTAVQGLRQF
jgi:glycerol kinase